MIYILTGITGIGLLACAAELLGRVADRTGITDRLFRLFDLPAEKESAPTVGAAEGTKVIYIGYIIPRYTKVVKEETR